MLSALLFMSVSRSSFFSDFAPPASQNRMQAVPQEGHLMLCLLAMAYKSSHVGKRETTVLATLDVSEKRKAEDTATAAAIWHHNTRLRGAGQSPAPHIAQAPGACLSQVLLVAKLLTCRESCHIPSELEQAASASLRASKTAGAAVAQACRD